MKNTITQEHVDSQIVDIHTTTVYEKVTVVSVRLRNGFVLVESAGAVDKANYSEEIGRRICLDRIKNKIWELEGYQLSTQLVQPYEFSELRVKADAMASALDALRHVTQPTWDKCASAACTALNEYRALTSDEPAISALTAESVGRCAICGEAIPMCQTHEVLLGGDIAHVECADRRAK